MAISAKDVAALRAKTGAGMMDCKKALTENDGDFDAAAKWLREKGMSAAKKREDRDATEGKVVIVYNDDKTIAAIVEVNSETDFVARNEEFGTLCTNLAMAALENADKADENGDLPVDIFDITELKGLAGKIGENLGLKRAAIMKIEGTGKIDDYIHPGDQLGVLINIKGDEAALTAEATTELAHDLAMQIAAAAPKYVRKEEVPQEVLDNEIEIYKNQMRNEGKPEEMLEKIALGKVNKYYEEVCLLNQLYVKEQKMKVSQRIAEAAKAAGGELDIVNFLRFKVGEGK